MPFCLRLMQNKSNKAGVKPADLVVLVDPKSDIRQKYMMRNLTEFHSQCGMTFRGLMDKQNIHLFFCFRKFHAPPMSFLKPPDY